MTSNRTLIRRLVCTATALWLGASAMPAAAQADYPNKPVRMLIGFPPGQATDTLGRAIAQKLSQQLANSSSSKTNRAPPASLRLKRRCLRRQTAIRCW